MFKVNLRKRGFHFVTKHPTEHDVRVHALKSVKRKQYYLFHGLMRAHNIRSQFHRSLKNFPLYSKRCLV